MNLAMQVHLSDAAAVAAHFRDLALLPKEVLVVAAVDHRGALLGQQRLHGQATAVVAQPRDLLRFVLAANAVAMILIHNHPSGRLAPSHADLKFTAQVQAAAALCGLQLLDHVIIASTGWLSLRHAGWMELP